MSGSGKGTVLKALEDAGYYSVDNLPIDLIPKFAELTKGSPNIQRAALVVDVREGGTLKRFPAMFREVRRKIATKLIFLEADSQTLVRRFSETRRPHPLGGEATVIENVEEERRRLAPIRRLADQCIDSSRFNVHELRDVVKSGLGGAGAPRIRIYVNSFGFRHGVPDDSDLVFDVRFLPNPNYIPEFKHLTGRHASVARYIRSFPQTEEFVNRISDLLVYLLPHYIREGKSYLTIAFGCTGGHHRSVFIANEVRKRLARAGFAVSSSDRDLKHPV